MRVTAYSGTAFNADLPTRQTVYQAREQGDAERRSLIVQPAARISAHEPVHSARPLASFLAQLIAKAEAMPETRQKRRIDPAEGASLYRAAMRGATAAPRRLREI
jgi:hypothetical protein